MQNNKVYKTIVFVLSIVVIIESILLVYLWPLRPKKISKKPAQLAKAKIAIVIDDWGYNLNNLGILEKIKYPLTAAVLPHLNYSKVLAEELHRRGLEIILHLPMEPHEKFRLEQNTIMAGMDEQAISNIMENDLSNLSYARGVSNHMGSRATEDISTVSVIFNKLKEKNLYFLDSLVTSNTVCADLAKRMRVRFVKRDVFLDNELDAGYIRRQINQLKMKARVYGYAVGIGHDQKVTLETLKEIMPELEKEGYRFVFVSELTR